MPYIQWIVFILFTALVGLLTWWRTRGRDQSTSTGYFLAGRSLGAVVIAGSLLLTNLSTEQLVGLNGAAFDDGFVVIAWEVIPGIVLALMALFFLPRFLRSGIATVPEFLGERFNAATRGITTIIFIVAYAGILLPIILYTGATGLDGMLQMEELLGIEARLVRIAVLVVVIGGIGSVYAIVGGLSSVAISDTLNGIGLLVGGGLIAWLGLRAVGDGGAWSGLMTLVETHPQKFDSIGTWEQSVPFSTVFTGVLLLNLFYWCTNQQIIQRTFAAKSLAEGQKGVLLAGALKVLTPIILVLPGIIAFHLFAAELDHPDEAYGTLVQEVLPPWLIGFFAAVVVGAILSSFNSALNSCATLFSLGVYQSMFRPDASDERVIRVGKRFGWVVAIIAMIAAPPLIYTEQIFSYLQMMNGLYFIPIFAVVLMGSIDRRMPAAAANWALVTGCGVIAAGYFVPPLYAGVVAPMKEYHFLGAVFLLLVGLMLGIRLLRPRPSAWKQAHSGDVDMTPWPHAKWVAAALAVIVVGLYIGLAGAGG